MVVFDDGSMRRRRLLTLAGGTVTIAVAGCLDDEDPDDTDDETDDTEDDQDDENGETENGETDGEEDMEEEDDPAIESIDIDVSESVIAVADEITLTVTAQYDDGSEETVTEDATITSDDESLASVSNGTISWGAGGEVTLTVEYEGFEETATVETQSEEDEMFEAEGIGGYISFAEDTEDDAEEEGIQFPTNEEDGEAIFIEAIVDDGTWESTSVEFPDVEVSIVDASISAIDGFSGKIDLDSGLMTAEGTLEVTVFDDSFSFDIAATSEVSGDLSGDVDTDSTPKQVTLVDNEYVIEEETGNNLIDDEINLPADQPGENWLVLTFEMVSE